MTFRIECKGYVRIGVMELALHTKLPRTDQRTKNYGVGSSHKDQGAEKASDDLIYTILL